MTPNTTLPPMYSVPYPRDAARVEHLVQILQLYDNKFSIDILDQWVQEKPDRIFVLHLEGNILYSTDANNALDTIRFYNPMFSPAHFHAQVSEFDLDTFLYDLHK